MTTHIISTISDIMTTDIMTIVIMTPDIMTTDIMTIVIMTTDIISILSFAPAALIDHRPWSCSSCCRSRHHHHRPWSCLVFSWVVFSFPLLGRPGRRQGGAEHAPPRPAEGMMTKMKMMTMMAMMVVMMVMTMLTVTYI